MKRYHPFLVMLHWLLAVLLIAALFMGSNVLSEIPNSDPEKLFSLRMHMSIGAIILVLTLIRLVVRLKSKKPPHADIGNALLNKLGVLAHYVLYLLVILMAASGIAISVLAGLPDIVFGGSGAALPTSFDAFPPRAMHGIIAKLLMLTIIAHVLAALYHQFVRKDSLLSRMWFGERS
ncbi:MAG: cytochrome b [Thiolinea sp.]